MRSMRMRWCSALRQPAWMARTAAPTCASLYGVDVLLEEVDQAALLLQQAEQAQRAGRGRVVRRGLRGGGRRRAAVAHEGDEQGEQRCRPRAGRR